MCVEAASPCASAVENVKEVLKLSTEQKGALVSVGELTVYLDGPTVGEPPPPLTNGSAANSANSECFCVILKGNGLTLLCFLAALETEWSMSKQGLNAPNLTALPPPPPLNSFFL